MIFYVWQSCLQFYLLATDLDKMKLWWICWCSTFFVSSAQIKKGHPVTRLKNSCLAFFLYVLMSCFAICKKLAPLIAGTETCSRFYKKTIADLEVETLVVPKSNTLQRYWATCMFYTSMINPTQFRYSEKLCSMVVSYCSHVLITLLRIPSTWPPLVTGIQSE